MLPPLPRCSRWAYSSLKLAPSISAFPDSTIASACTSSFSRFARRSLALRPAHSRSHQIRDRYPGASDISSPPCLPRLLPAGAIAGWALHPLEKRRLVTAHVGSGHSHQISLTSSRFRYQALRGLRRSLSLDLPVSRSQVHTTSFARDLPPGARELTRSRGFT